MPAKKKAKRAPRTVNKEAKRCGLCPAGEQMHPIEDFYLTSNPIYSDGRLPVCKVCMAKTLLGEDYTKLQTKPFVELLRKMDAPWFPEMMDAAVSQYNRSCQGKTVDATSRKQIVGNYIKNINIKPYKGMDWQQSQEFVAEKNKGEPVQITRPVDVGFVPVTDPDKPMFAQEQDDITEITDDVIKLFGEGYKYDEYRRMWSKYNQLKESYVDFTSFHTEALVTYVRFKVQEEIAVSKGNITEAQKWAKMSADAADRAKINPKQMSKADLEGGINSFSELSQAIEQAVDVIPILPQFRYKPNDAADFIIWCLVNYLRRLEDKPECTYEDVYRFYDDRKKSYIEQYGDPTGIFIEDPTETNRSQIEKFIVLPNETVVDNGPEEVTLGGD